MVLCFLVSEKYLRHNSTLYESTSCVFVLTFVCLFLLVKSKKKEVHMLDIGSCDPGPYCLNSRRHIK